MKIGWMIRAGGIFGSVREAIEIGNALTRIGHEFTMYTDEGRDLLWLPNTLQWRFTNEVTQDDLDVLIWSDSPDDPYWAAFHKSKAKLKGYCVMGFDPAHCTPEQFLSPRHHELLNNFWTLYDGAWQGEYIANYTTNHGPDIGGVNTSMFRPVEQEPSADVIWSGDPRPRKGGDMVKEAIRGLKSDFYSKKRIKQEDMAAFICKAKIFVDGHNRGGFCNPVLEAMACGRAVVCTETPCNSDFAVHGYNCLQSNTPQGIRDHIERLREDPALLQSLAQNALITARAMTYDDRAIWLEMAMKERLA